MKLVDFALPVIILLGFSTLWHTSLILSMASNPSSASRNFSLAVAMVIFVANVSAAMWIISAIGLFR